MEPEPTTTRITVRDADLPGELPTPCVQWSYHELKMSLFSVLPLYVRALSRWDGNQPTTTHWDSSSQK